jgi:hypothetical protein
MYCVHRKSGTNTPISQRSATGDPRNCTDAMKQPMKIQWRLSMLATFVSIQSRPTYIRGHLTENYEFKTWLCKHGTETHLEYTTMTA